MPSLYYRIEAPGVNILNTVTEQVVSGLLDEFDLTRYFKDSVYILSGFTSYSQYNDGKGTPTLNKNRCDVIVEHVMDKTQVPWPVDTPYTTTALGMRTSHKGNHTPIFLDKEANILIEHHTTACAINLDFSLSFQTFDDACKAFDTIKSRHNGSLVQMPFDLSFSYPVSMGLYKYLVAVYQAKTAYSSKTFLEYLKDMQKTEISFDIRKSQIVNPNADKELMIRCIQLNSVGQLTMDLKEPEVQREGQLPTNYTVSFSYVIQFGRPNLIVVNTPVSVDNTVLPYGLFENRLINYHHNPYVGGVYQDLMCGEFMRRSYGNFDAAHQLVRIPSYDDWFVVDSLYIAYEYRPLIIAHFTLDGPETSLNIGILDDVELHPIGQDILRQIGNDVFEYGGLFHVAVYADNLKLGRELLNLDGSLNLTVVSSRPDKVYHLVISETTNLQKTSPTWNELLIKYRYFFPMTIERNIQFLVNKKYFYIAYDNSLLNFINSLSNQLTLKPVLNSMILSGDITNEIYQYTQNSSQLADYMAYTQSQNKTYELPTGSDLVSVLIRSYYNTYASVEGRSLLVVFLEKCLAAGYITLDKLPKQYLSPNNSVYPYAAGQGGYYGFNTPFRVANYIIRT